MLKSKKIRLLLGSMIAIVPTSSVIACSTSSEISDEDSKLIATATSSTALRVLQKEWMKKVILNQYDEILNIDDLEGNFKIGKGSWIGDSRPNDNDLPDQMPTILDETIKFHLASKIASNPKYLNDIATNLLKLVESGKDGVEGKQKYTTSSTGREDTLVDLRKIGIQNEYLYGYNQDVQDFWDESISYIDIGGNSAGTTRYRAIVNVLMSEPTLEFSSEIFKYLLVNSYLTMKYSDWEKLYPDKADNLSEIDKIIDKRENFELTRMLLEKKYFFKWELELDETKSSSWIGEDEITSDDENDPVKPISKALNEFLYNPKVSFDESKTNGYQGYNQNIIGKSTFTKRNAKLFESVIDFSNGNPIDTTILSRINHIGGYSGITSLSSTGKGKLNFTKKGYEEAKGTPDYWFGFYESNDSETNLVDDKIKYFGGTESLKAKMTFVFGLMPLYHPITNESNSTEKLSLDGTYFSTDNRIEELARILYNQEAAIYDQAFDWFIKPTDDGGKNILIKVENKMLREKYKSLDLKYIDYDNDSYK